jgi:hypothetical protein
MSTKQVRNVMFLFMMLVALASLEEPLLAWGSPCTWEHPLEEGGSWNANSCEDGAGICADLGCMMHAYMSDQSSCDEVSENQYRFNCYCCGGSPMP